MHRYLEKWNVALPTYYKNPLSSLRVIKKSNIFMFLTELKFI